MRLAKLRKDIEFWNFGPAEELQLWIEKDTVVQVKYDKESDLHTMICFDCVFSIKSHEVGDTFEYI